MRHFYLDNLRRIAPANHRSPLPSITKLLGSGVGATLSISSVVAGSPRPSSVDANPVDVPGMNVGFSTGPEKISFASSKNAHQTQTYTCNFQNNLHLASLFNWVGAHEYRSSTSRSNTQNEMASLRRSTPANPKRPLPSNTRLLGSGVCATV
jgi:hypothetical protein